MASYGIGPGRVMGTVVEVSHDDAGIIWPKSIAPFSAHLVSIQSDERCDEIYATLTKSNISVLYDDRSDKSAGEKFADADLIGCPVRITVGGKTPEGKFEVKMRNGDETKLVSETELISLLS